MEANQARQTLTRNVRAHDADDRRDQQHFRDGETERALAGYHRRGHIHPDATPEAAEAAALRAAQDDRRAGRDVLVLAQTSNEHLDVLNARAQALRIADGGVHGPGHPVPGRPYALHAGDQVQLRRTFTTRYPPEPIPNGTTGTVLAAHPTWIAMQLDVDGQPVIALEHDELARADVRLAYVQHPFPAQGVTSDTTHLIVTDHTTQQGAYVGLTRARQHTTIHAPVDPGDPDWITELAERMSRTEPDIPSIHIPLAHEAEVARAAGAAQEPGPAEDRRDPGSPPALPRYLTNTLGQPPPPLNPRREEWLTASAAISRYRLAHHIPPDTAAPLGDEPPPGRFRERQDYQHAETMIKNARETLGLPPTPELRTQQSRDRELDGYEP